MMMVILTNLVNEMEAHQRLLKLAKGRKVNTLYVIEAKINKKDVF